MSKETNKIIAVVLLFLVLFIMMAVVLYVSGASISWYVIFGFMIFFLTVMAIAAFVSFEENKAPKSESTFTAIQFMRDQWQVQFDEHLNNMPDLSERATYDNNKEYIGAIFRVSSGKKKEEKRLIIYCINDKSISKINETPSHEQLSNPLHKFAPKKSSNPIPYWFLNKYGYPKNQSKQENTGQDYASSE